jgi:Permease family
MGLWARLPFVVAPGMEMNAYVAFYAVGALGFTWQQALGMVFWSSVIMIVLTLASIRERIIDSIPESMKVGLAFSVGVFLMLIALRTGGMLEYEGLILRGFGSLLSPSAYALYLGLACVLVLDRLKVPGAVLIGILVTAGFCHLIGAGGGSDAIGEVSSRMFSAIGQLDLGIILDPRAASVILVLFVLDFYGSVAKFIGLTLNTNIMRRRPCPAAHPRLAGRWGGQHGRRAHRHHQPDHVRRERRRHRRGRQDRTDRRGLWSAHALLLRGGSAAAVRSRGRDHRRPGLRGDQAVSLAVADAPGVAGRSPHAGDHAAGHDSDVCHRSRDAGWLCHSSAGIVPPAQAAGSVPGRIDAAPGRRRPPANTLIRGADERSR